MAPSTVALTILLPGAIGAACFLAPALVGVREKSSVRPAEGPGAFAVLGAGLPFIAAAAFVLGKWPTFPPRQSTDWLPYLAIAATVAGVLVALAAPKRSRLLWAGAALLLLYAGAVLALPLRSAGETQMGVGWGTERITLMLLAAAAVVAPSLGAASVAARAKGPAPGTGLAAAFAVSSLAIVFSASAKLAQIESLLVAGAVGAVLAGLMRRDEIALGAPAAAVLVALHATIWLLARYYADATVPVFWLGALSPLGLAVLGIPWVAARSTLARCAAAAAACALPAMIAAAIAYQRYTASVLPY